MLSADAFRRDAPAITSSGKMGFHSGIGSTYGRSLETGDPEESRSLLERCRASVLKTDYLPDKGRLLMFASDDTQSLNVRRYHCASSMTFRLLARRELARDKIWRPPPAIAAGLLVCAKYTASSIPPSSIHPPGHKMM